MILTTFMSVVFNLGEPPSTSNYKLFDVCGDTIGINVHLRWSK